MAACSVGVATPSTTDGTSFTTGSFTPAAGDLLIALVSATGTVAAGSMSDSQGLGWTKVDSGVYNTSADTYYVFIANALAAASSMTATFDCTGDSATGANVMIVRVSGMTKTGASALRQSAKVQNQTVSPIAIPSLAQNALTTNPTIEMFAGGENEATFPAGWTDQSHINYATPNGFAQYHTRDSGFTGTSTGWSDTLSTPYGIILLELDASGVVYLYVPNRIPNPRVGPMALRNRFREPYYQAPSVSGVIFQQALDATVSTTASLQKQVNKLLTVTVTSTPTLQKQTNKGLTASTVSITPSLQKQVNKGLSANVSILATLQTIKTAVVNLTATVTVTPTLQKQVNKIVSTNVTIAPSLVKTVLKNLTGNVSITASLQAVKVVVLNLLATVNITASIQKQTNKNLSATVTATPTLQKTTMKTLVANSSITATLNTVYQAASGAVQKLRTMMGFGQ
jgi:hypothetical protein